MRSGTPSRFSGLASPPLVWSPLLVWSLGLNAALIIAAILRFAPLSWPGPDPRPGEAGPSRIERLAVTLPSADAARLRAAFAADAAAVTQAEDAFDAGRDAVRVTLRRKPFDVAAFNAALGRSTALRCALERIVHDDLARAVPDISPLGRDRLADWPGSGR